MSKSHIVISMSATGHARIHAGQAAAARFLVDQKIMPHHSPKEMKPIDSFAGCRTAIGRCFTGELKSFAGHQWKAIDSAATLDDISEACREMNDRRSILDFDPRRLSPEQVAAIAKIIDKK